MLNINLNNIFFKNIIIFFLVSFSNLMCIDFSNISFDTFIKLSNEKNKIDFFSEIFDDYKNMFQQRFFEIKPNQNKNYMAGIVTTDTDKLLIVGDLHAEFDSLKLIIEDMIERKCIDENLKLKEAYLVFLGDYIDRGPENFKTLSLLMILKLKNPGKVFLLKGNHEGNTFNSYGILTPYFEFYGEENTTPSLYGEIFKQYLPHSTQYENIKKQLLYFFKTLPVALFEGKRNKKTNEIDYSILSHGGFDIRINYSKFLEDCSTNKIGAVNLCFINNIKLNIENFPNNSLEQNLCNTLKTYGYLKEDSFFWTDIDFFENYMVSPNFESRGLVYNVKWIKSFFEKFVSKSNQYKVCSVIRGHQHSLPYNKNKLNNIDDDYNKCGISNMGDESFNVITLISSNFLLGKDDKSKKEIRYNPSYIIFNGNNDSNAICLEI